MNRMKKVLAVLLTAAIMLTATGCYSPDNSWAMKDGDNTMSIGSYIYYLYSSYDYAAQEIPDNEEVLKAVIDGQPVDAWIREKAMDLARCSFWIDRKIKELDLALTQEESENTVATTESHWQYVGTALDKLGVSKESFNAAFAAYNLKCRKVFDHYYGEGGERALSKQEISNYFTENNHAYSYMFAALTTADSQGKMVELTQEQRADLDKAFENYKLQIGTGYYTLETAAQDYALAANLDKPPYESAVNDLKYQYFPANFLNNLTEMGNGEIRIFESDGQLILLQKGDIDVAAEEMYSNPSQRLKLALELKADEFASLISELAAKEVGGIDLNKPAMEGIKLADFVNENNKMGTLTEEDAPE